MRGEIRANDRLPAGLRVQLTRYSLVNGDIFVAGSRPDGTFEIHLPAGDSSDVRSSFVSRDEAMAENVGWILDQEGPGSRIVLWAHNGHISRRFGRSEMDNMGTFLARKFGSDYMAIGFVFSDGSFQAVNATGVRTL